MESKRRIPGALPGKSYVRIEPGDPNIALHRVPDPEGVG